LKRNEVTEALRRIAPDDAAKDRMLKEILKNSKTEKESFTMNRRIKILAPIAACLVLALAGAFLLPGLLAPPVDQGTTEPGRQSFAALPLMLGGQAVNWSSEKNESAQEPGDPADDTWAINLDAGDGTSFTITGTDTIFGSLADGRKVTLAKEAVDPAEAFPEETDVPAEGTTQASGAPDTVTFDKQNSQKASVQVLYNLTDVALEVGATVCTVRFSDGESTTAWRFYIESIE